MLCRNLETALISCCNRMFAEGFQRGDIMIKGRRGCVPGKYCVVSGY